MILVLFFLDAVDFDGKPVTGSKFENCQAFRDGGGNIEDEFTAKLGNEPGTLSMANTGAPNSGGSQFFINVNNNSFLNWFDRSTPSAHPVFGKVVEGYDLLEKISQVPTDPRDCPEDPVKMIKITVEGV